MVVLSTGCFYFLPLIPVERNVPPYLVRTSVPSDTPILVDDDGTVVYIIVGDDDDAEALTFVWAISDEGLVPGAQTIPDGAIRRASQIRLYPDDNIDGAELTVIVSDGGSGADRRIEVSWPIVVETGATP